MPSPPKGPTTNMPKRIISAIPAEVWTFLAILVIWQGCVTILSIPEIFVPGVGVVFDEIWTHQNFYLTQSFHTIGNTLAAFLLSVVLGVGMAIGIVYNPILEKTLYAALVALNNVPKIALAPLFVIWMGTGQASKIAMGVLISIFAIVIDAVLGLRSVTSDMVDLGLSLRGSSLKTLLKIRLPNALPSILAGMKVAMSLSLVGALVGEFVAAQNGLGYVIMSSQGAFRTDRVFAAITLLAIIGTALFYALEALELVLIPWHESHRGKKRRVMSPVAPVPLVNEVRA
jgi:NitT/TauT family transport system permease protein